ncbi:Hsp70 family protein [Nocardia sp. NPDC058114]|uniref:Hsp70 family protein n=1 Tax=Nocardia sp. NPDC058114 TaxID=3346346 RepID=UPI0036DCED40
MTRGLGLSIGAVNAISAVVADDPAKPAVRTRRTALTFDDAGRPRIGAINEFASAITDFADLTREPEPMVMGGRFYSATNLIAAVVTGLIELAEPPAGIVLTYPAVYTDKQVSLLGQALHLAGAGEVLLVPEPVAAAEWLEVDRGPLEPGFVLVYDLGATSLDLTVLRVGPDWPHHPMVGTPTRSIDFGGKPLGEMVARYAGDPGPGRATQTLTSMVNIDALRAEHIRDTFPLVSKSVSAAGLRLADLSRILVVGGASRPPEVARTLAELGVPLVTVADPGQVIASGAAGLAARTFAPEQQTGGPVPHVAVFSSAAVVSALAMSAMTVFGSPFDPGLMPVLDRFPVLGAPADALLYDMSADLLAARTAGLVSDVDPLNGRIRVAGIAAARSAYENFIAPATAPGGTSRPGGSADRGAPGRLDVSNDCKSPVLARTTYGDPARFINPLPFGQQAAQPQNTPTNPGTPELPHSGPVSSPGTPAVPGTPTSPGTVPAVGNAPSPGTAPTDGTSTPTGGTSTPSSGGVTVDVGGSTPTGGTGTGTTPSSPGTSTGGTGGTTSGGTPTGGTTDGDTTGGATGGGTSSGTGTSGGSTGGGASDGGASNGGGTGGGGASGGGSDGGASGGGASGGGASGGGASGGGASGGGASGGGASGGGASSGGGSDGGASGGGASGGGASGGGASGGGASGGGASGGGASGGGASGGGASGGGVSGGASSGGGSDSGVSSGGAASGGASSGGASSGGASSGGSKGGASAGGSTGGGGGGGGGGSRR